MAYAASLNGAIAQLVERFAGSEEVRGSTPLGSTISLAQLIVLYD